MPPAIINKTAMAIYPIACPWPVGARLLLEPWLKVEYGENSDVEPYE